MSPYSATVLVVFLSAALVGFARGGRSERIGASIIAAWIVVDASYHLAFGPAGFVRVDPAHVAFDAAELAAMVWLALRSERLWPLWAAAAQLICVAGHLAAWLEPGGMRRAYWVMTQLPPYLQLVALLWGTATHARRAPRG